MSRRLPLLMILTLASGLAIGAAGALVLAPRSATAADPGVTDRAALEALLATRPVVPTGRIRAFELSVQYADWELLPGVVTRAVTFNGTVPGPIIRVTEGDLVEIRVTNELTEPTSVHWHGLHVPNVQDGVPGVTQDPIAPGATFAYRFLAPHAGTFMYHSHGPSGREQIDRGLYGPFIIDPAGGDAVDPDADVTLALQGWMIGDQMAGMDGMSMEYNYFTINGKSFPATETLTVNEGDLVRLRFINPSQTIHPMHLHGMDMAIVAKDGEQLPEPERINTLDIAQGETYEVVFRADNPGTWLLHCHDLHHASNAGVEPGGLIVAIVVRPAQASPSGASAQPASAAPAGTPAPVPSMTEMPGMSL